MIFEHVEKCVFYSVNKLHIQTKTDENNPMVHLRKLTPFVAFLIFGGISVLLWQNQNRHERELVRRHTETSSEQIRIRIEGLMNARMASLESLAERWVERNPPDFSQNRFLEFAEMFYSHYPGFWGIHWIDPEGVVRWVFPKDDNEPITSHRPKYHNPLCGTYPGRAWLQHLFAFNLFRRDPRLSERSISG